MQDMNIMQASLSPSGRSAFCFRVGLVGFYVGRVVFVGFPQMYIIHRSAGSFTAVVRQKSFDIPN
jgi:hypothetical protein